MSRISVVPALFFLLACSHGHHAAEPQEVLSDSGALVGVFTPMDGLHVGHNHITVELYEGERLIDASVMEVEPWMPHHGHGSPQPATVTRVEGAHEVEVFFNMAGHWELHVAVQSELGSDSFVVPLEVH